MRWRRSSSEARAGGGAQLKLNRPFPHRPPRLRLVTSSYAALEEFISNFFSKLGACTSRSQCDAFANETFGGPITPVPVQGTCSYTVTNGTTIIKFREPGSPLDIQTLAAVQAVHPGFVANHCSHGTIGEFPALHVYSVNVLPGDNYFDLSLSLMDDDLDHRMATVRSLARFGNSRFDFLPITQFEDEY